MVIVKIAVPFALFNPVSLVEGSIVVSLQTGYQVEICTNSETIYFKEIAKQASTSHFDFACLPLNFYISLFIINLCYSNCIVQ